MSRRQLVELSMIPALVKVEIDLPALIVSMAFMFWLQALVNANSPIRISVLMILSPIVKFRHLEDQNLLRNSANHLQPTWPADNMIQPPSKAL